MKREFKIEKFRNIGLENKETLVLNNSMQKGQMGNLVILVGENNSGKSNILDALLTFASRQFEDRDITDLKYEENYRVPKLSLITKSDDEYYKYKITGRGERYIDFTENDKVDNSELISESIRLLALISNQCTMNGVTEYNEKIERLRQKFSSNMSNGEFKQAYSELSNLLKNIFNSGSFYSHMNAIRKNITNLFSEFPLIKSLNRNREVDTELN